MPYPNSTIERNKSTNNAESLKKIVLNALEPELDDEKAELVGQLQMLFHRAKDLRRTKVAQWDKNYRILENRTWSMHRAPWLPNPEVPELFPIIDAAVGWCTDQRPIIEVRTAAEPGSDFYTFYSILAQDLQTCIQTGWVLNDIDAEWEAIIWDAYQYGTGIVKTIWDQSLVDGLGDATQKRVDPYSFYPDPDARRWKEATHFIEATIISLQELDRRFPGSAEYFHDGSGYQQIDEPPDLDNNSGQLRANPGQMNNPSGAFGQPVVSNGSNRYSAPGVASPRGVLDQLGVTLFEFWLREHYIEDGKMIDTWRCVIMAGNRILFNEPVKNIWDHGQHPYDRFVLQDRGRIWEKSMVELLAPSQLAINRLLAALQHNTELTGNPVLVEDNQSNIQRSLITNQPGQRITKAAGGTAEWLQPPSASPMMLQLIEFYIMEMERISGLTAMARGLSPGGRVAGDVLTQVQDASFVRVRKVLKNLERAIRSSGQKYASLITEFYDQHRVVQIVGDTTGETTALSILDNHFYELSPKQRLPLRFQLVIDAGSMHASARPARIAEADALFAMGAIDEPAVLDAHNFPNRHIIAPRVEQKKAAGIMAEASQRQRTGRKA